MSDNNGSAAGGQPGADGAGNGNGAGGEGGSGGADPRWYANAPEDLRGFADLKGWDTPEKALSSYRDLEKFTGVPAEQLLKLPKDAEDVDGWNAAKTRLGFAAPESADKYELTFADGTPEGYSKGLRDILHKHGVPAGMAKATFEGINALQAEMAKADEQAYETANANAMTKLKTEWGGNFEQLSQLADRAQNELAKDMGLDEATLSLLTDVLGPAGTLRMFAGLGGKLGEAKYVSGESAQLGPMTPEAALAKRDQLVNDAGWQKRYQDGDVKARQEWEQITTTLAHAAASSGVVR